MSVLSVHTSVILVSSVANLTDLSVFDFDTMSMFTALHGMNRYSLVAPQP